jgi:hypothetical protein
MTKIKLTSNFSLTLLIPTSTDIFLSSYLELRSLFSSLELLVLVRLWLFLTLLKDLLSKTLFLSTSISLPRLLLSRLSPVLKISLRNLVLSSLLLLAKR